jgi:hypothetical protein
MLPIRNPKVDTIISLLNEIEVDGETMQHIIEKVGMEDQMLKQLILTYPADAIQVISHEVEQMEWNA